MGVFSKRDSHYAFKELDTSAIIQRERRLRLDCGEGEQETFKLFQWDTRWSAFTFDAPRLRLSQQFFPSLSKKEKEKKEACHLFQHPLRILKSSLSGDGGSCEVRHPPLHSQICSCISTPEKPLKLWINKLNSATSHSNEERVFGIQ